MVNSDIKSFVKRNFPFVVSDFISVKLFLKRFITRRISNQKIFLEICHKCKWGDTESLSGPGSSLAQTEKIRSELPLLLAKLGAKSLLDIPCGDFNWMKEIDLTLESYIGADIVDEITAVNNQKFGQTNRRFMPLDITKDELPRVDIVLCRDCFVHFSYRDIARAITNIKISESRYILTTTFNRLNKNINIFTGDLWRPLNFQIAPFNWPKPIEIINEGCTEGDNKFQDKSMGLWKISDIPV